MSGTVAVCLLPGSARYPRAERRTRLCTGPLLGDHGLSRLEPKKTPHRIGERAHRRGRCHCARVDKEQTRSARSTLAKRSTPLVAEEWRRVESPRLHEGSPRAGRTRQGTWPVTVPATNPRARPTGDITLPGDYLILMSLNVSSEPCHL